MNREALMEAFDWALFTGGGFLAAFFIPAHIVMTNIAGPVGFSKISLDYSTMIVRLNNPLIRLYLFLVLGSSIWFCMNRIRHVLYGIGLSGHRNEVTVITFVALAILLMTILYAVI